MELVKRQDRYDLYGDDGSKIASSSPNPFGKLSKQNCDEIFGVVDVKKLANKYVSENDEYFDNYKEKGHSFVSFKDGFNKAMELNKDKLFGVKEVVELCKILLSNPFEKCGKTYQELTDNYIQSLQQPTEIEVESEMVCPQCKDWGYVDECRNNCNKKFLQQKLDENGCLILKKL